MNSAVGPSFKVRFMFFRTWGSREQCMGPSQKMQTRIAVKFKYYSLVVLSLVLFMIV